MQDRAVDWAMSKVGARECRGEQPAWNRASGFSCSTAWCGIFVRQAYRAAGVELGQIASVDTIYNNATANRGRMRKIPVAEIRKGDLVMMYLRNTPRRNANHVAIARGNFANGVVPTVEGNISDKVISRTRSVSDVSNGRRVLVAGVRIG